MISFGVGLLKSWGCHHPRASSTDTHVGRYGWAAFEKIISPCDM